MSEEDYHKAELGFEPSVLAGIDTTSHKDQSPCATALIGHPDNCFGGAYGKCVARESEQDTVAFVFTISTKALNVKTSQIVVGVCDASRPPPCNDNSKEKCYCIGLHIGRSKVVRSFNSHKLVAGSQWLGRDTPRKLPIDANGRVRVTALCDMSSRRLLIAVNDGEPVDAGYLLPWSVRPWVWFGGPGVGSVTLAEYTRHPAPPPSAIAMTARPGTARAGTGSSPTSVVASLGIRPSTAADSSDSTGAFTAAAPTAAMPLSAGKVLPRPPFVVDVSDVSADAAPLPPVAPLSLMRCHVMPGGGGLGESTTDSSSDSVSTSSEKPMGLDDPCCTPRTASRAAEWLRPLQIELRREDAEKAGEAGQLTPLMPAVVFAGTNGRPPSCGRASAKVVPVQLL